jgi:hypothetical protein
MRSPYTVRIPIRCSVVRRSATKRVAKALAQGRLANARAFLESARNLIALAEKGASGNPTAVQAINAGIAYADALTIRGAEVQNSGDHAAVVRLLKQVLGEQAAEDQLRRLAALIGRKDAVEYGHRSTTLAEATKMVEQAQRFAEWAEGVLARL